MRYYVEKDWDEYEGYYWSVVSSEGDICARFTNIHDAYEYADQWNEVDGDK